MRVKVSPGTTVTLDLGRLRIGGYTETYWDEGSAKMRRRAAPDREHRVEIDVRCDDLGTALRRAAHSKKGVATFGSGRFVVRVRK